MIQEHRDNLKKLATYLLSGKLKADFDMRYFSNDISISTRAGIYDPTCGSIGCAIGHGPYAGIPKIDEAWDEYAERVFGVESHPSCPTHRIFGWLFGSKWTDIDNTPEGAAKRIIYYLKHEDIPYTENLHDTAIYKNLYLADLEK